MQKMVEKLPKKSQEKKEKSKEPFIQIKDIIPLTLFFIFTFILYLIGFFDILSNIIEKLLGDTLDQNLTKALTDPSLLLFLILFIILSSYSYIFLKWTKIKEQSACELIKGKIFHRFFWIKSIIYIVSTITLIITFYWFRIHIFITGISESVVDKWLEPDQAEQFCPSFLFILVLLFIGFILWANNRTIDRELTTPAIEPVREVKFAQTSTGNAIVIIIAIIVTFTILYFSGFFDFLGEMLIPSHSRNGDVIEEWFTVNEVWYLYAPEAAWRSGSAPYSSGPYSSYSDCQSVNVDYYYGYGTCVQE